MKTNTNLILALVAVVVVAAGVAFYFSSGSALQGKITSSSDARTTCDYSSDTTTANLRECLEDIIIEYRSVEDENFGLLYERLNELEDKIDAL